VEFHTVEKSRRGGEEKVRQTTTTEPYSRVFIKHGISFKDGEYEDGLTQTLGVCPIPKQNGRYKASPVSNLKTATPLCPNFLKSSDTWTNRNYYVLGGEANKLTSLQQYYYN
jgi:hypothetical protein